MVPQDADTLSHIEVEGLGPAPVSSPSCASLGWAGAIVFLLAAMIYLPTLVGPHVMDDTDGAQAQIPRNMLVSGDWVTARLNGIPFLEKSPLLYWIVATSYAVFGVNESAARIPIVLGILVITWLIMRMGLWAFERRAAVYSGITFTTCTGLFLFTRILIPDVLVTGCIALTMWALIRSLDEKEEHPRVWAAVIPASMAIGVLLKGVIAVLFPVLAGLLFLTLSGQLRQKTAWRRLRPFSGVLIFLGLVMPWFILAILRNPPYFDFAMTSEPGRYRGFFWFYFFNEHILRFLNRRWPRDYDTVPRHLFWLFHLVWFFPWSAYLPQLSRLTYRGTGRAARMRLLCLCWIACVMVFFTFSTTQEYYSMPIYPAVALLLGCALAMESNWLRIGAKVLASVVTAAALAIGLILFRVWDMPAPGDISSALTQHLEMYTLSLGHMGDLTLASFAYLKTPLALAGLACLCGSAAAWRWRGPATQFGLAAMMVLFLNAARLAMVAFDPYLSTQPLAEVLKDSPPGTVILGDQYYVFSSVFYYADLKQGLLLNGRYQNLEYGSYAPGASNVFVTDGDLKQLWEKQDRAYLILEGPKVAEVESLLGKQRLFKVQSRGGKFLFTNQALGERPGR